MRPPVWYYAAILLVLVVCPVANGKTGHKERKPFFGPGTLRRTSEVADGASWLAAHPAFISPTSHRKVNKNPLKHDNFEARVKALNPLKKATDFSETFTHNPPALEVKRVHNTRLDDPKPSKTKGIHNFIIVSEQRSGTGFFIALLNEHPNITCATELFLKGVCRNKAFDKCHKDKIDRVFGYKGPDWAKAKVAGKAVGFKWMMSQGLMVHKAEVLEYAKKHGLRLVFLWRRNVLRQLISRAVLKKTSIPHPTKSSEVKKALKYQPKLDVESLEAHFDAVLTDRDDAEKYWAEQLGEENVWTVFYEDLLGDQTGHLLKIQRFLGVEAFDERQMDRKNFVQAIHLGMPIRELVANPDEVVNKLKGGKYRPFLDDEGDVATANLFAASRSGQESTP